jgi:hypothetical protein
MEQIRGCTVVLLTRHHPAEISQLIEIDGTVSGGFCARDGGDAAAHSGSEAQIQQSKMHTTQEKENATDILAHDDVMAVVKKFRIDFTCGPEHRAGSEPPDWAGCGQKNALQGFPVAFNAMSLVDEHSDLKGPNRSLK